MIFQSTTTKKKNLLAKLLVTIVLLVPPSLLAFISAGQSPETIKSLIEYYESGQYYDDISLELKKTLKYIEIQLRNRKSSQLAVIFDIDETALSNYPHLKRTSFTGNPEAFAGAYMAGQSPAIEPVLAFYNYLLNHNIAIFFVTDRPNTPEISAATLMNLKRAGYHSWEDIYMRPISNDKLSIADYKMHARRDITQKGYEIILSIDDQTEGLKGGYTEAKVKIPNPFYESSPS